MFTITSPSHWVEETYYRHDFQLIGDYPGNGCSFDVDKYGKICTEIQKKNFDYCVAHPEKYKDMGIVNHKHRYKEDPFGKCDCGEEFYLVNEYLGACECPKCGQWYNLFGQELNPPETWSSGDDLW